MQTLTLVRRVYQWWHNLTGLISTMTTGNIPSLLRFTIALRKVRFLGIKTRPCVRDSYPHFDLLAPSNLGARVFCFGLTSNKAKGKWFPGIIQVVNSSDWSFTASFESTPDGQKKNGETVNLKKRTELEHDLHLMMPTVHLHDGVNAFLEVRSSFAFVQQLPFLSATRFLEWSCVSIISFKLHTFPFYAHVITSSCQSLVFP